LRRTDVPFKAGSPEADAGYMTGPRRVVAVLIGVLLASVVGTAWAGGPGKKPTVTGLSVSDVTPTSAVLKGTVKPEGQETTYQFEYGTTPSYGLHTPAASAGDGDYSQPVTVPVEGLQPETVYHYRLVATNSGGSLYTPDKTFFTLALPPGETPPPPGPGLVTPDAAAPAAKLGESVLVAPASGVLMVRVPGSSTFEPLELGSQLPVGSEVDARHGSLALTAALPTAATETGHFGGGRFKLGQDKRGYVDLYLRGRYCSRAAASVASVAGAARKKPGRRLWGRDHGGRFRTHGRNSHATVRGTRWLVVDTCKGTYTRVTEGSVVVRDKVRKKRIVLDAGEHYLARPRR
jgi:hypothetical protein